MAKTLEVSFDGIVVHSEVEVKRLTLEFFNCVYKTQGVFLVQYIGRSLAA